MLRSSATFLVLASCLACAPTPDDRPDRVRLTAAVDTMVDVGTHRLHLRVRRGDRPVTVLFEAGGAATLESWAGVPDSLAARSRASIVAYDRAGLGLSELGGLDLTPRDEVEDVRRALRTLELPERTIIVAHSYGAMIALLHAATFPEHVTGLVLVDPMNPRFVAEVGDWLKTTAPAITDPNTDHEFAVRRMVESMDSLSADLLDTEPSLDQPMWLVSAGERWWGREDIDAAWEASHRALAAATSRRSRTVAEGVGHDIPADDPAAVLAAIEGALERAGD